MTDDERADAEKDKLGRALIEGYDKVTKQRDELAGLLQRWLLASDGKFFTDSLYLQTRAALAKLPKRKG